ncbi:RmlC-like cupin domain-containing protein [Polychytrium aggregatum]|uniref:RmlC-like cupin domain-containing protein n=1 Tax=Polychytrium aggregatum TaxID=110093 RepID=UPI0022FEFBCE|nr:RmlC-like cupin domain-containing protein [Polychytrium aggregatum]KAI9205029.1 RmlC-like cupin domain-containing protein [Polychytrium aggregatum]
MTGLVKNPIKLIEKLSIPYKTLDPFLFCVYHKDLYPPGNEQMEPPRRGNGSDFDPNQDYRMYHGRRIPGFPQHPHRGFETITGVMEGVIDHSDSKGGAGRFGNGDLQWMTAGRGIVHGENFPLVNQDKPNVNRFFQIWLNLPAKSKMVEPSYVMHWGEKIPVHVEDDGKARVTIWAGELFGKKALPPTKDSWAADPAHHVGVFFIQLQPGGSFTFPASSSATLNRTFYVSEGPLVQLAVSGTEVKDIQNNHCVQVDPLQPLVFKNPSESGQPVELLLLQGEPINEPIAKYGPFVMNTHAEIQEAFDEYRRTEFGGWPWDADAVVFPREKGRFAIVNKKEIRP